MRASEREDMLYQNGKRIQMDKEENIMFGYLAKYAPQKARILDLGCGTGEISEKLCNMGYLPKGIDFSEVAIGIAREKGIDCETGDLDHGIKEQNDNYDVVWAGDVIEHVFDPIYLIEEIYRVLKPNGIFLFTVPYDVHLANRLRVFCGHSYQEPIYRQLRQCKHHTFFSEHLIDFMLSNAKLRRIETQYMLRVPKARQTYVFKHKWLNLLAYAMVIAAEKK